MKISRKIRHVTSKKVIKGRIINIISYALLLIFGFVFIYPIVYMILKSFMPQGDIFNPYVHLVPSRFVLDNYKLLFEKMNVFEGIGQSILLTFTSAALQVVSCGLMGYGLSRFDFKLKKLYIALVVISFVIPGQVLMIPSYLGYSELGLIGSKLSFFLPAAFGQGLKSSIFILIFYNFFNAIPRVLDEAAQIDGASSLQIFLRVAIPLSIPAVILTMIFSVVWYWNESYLTTLYIGEAKTLPIQMASVLSTMENIANKDPNAARVNIPFKMAANFVTIVPLLIFYSILQKQFVESVDRSGITGE
ncbi:MAG: carbohydrate ABC transporter permease [Lachnospiraceae bacterium]|nr:carbohydrate ABC transporter permease [Lachnospiraceae bacterium]